MLFRVLGLFLCCSALFSLPADCAASQEDSYLWLEEIEGERALDWVKARNSVTIERLERLPYYKDYLKTALKLVNDKERIPYATLRGGYFYNFWQDDHYVRGLWRRTPFEDYFKKKPRWEKLLDVDALAAAEGANWVYEGASCLPPENRRCLLQFSRGGKDASVVREFDVESKTFVKGGFYIPESKSDAAWVDQDTILWSDATDPELNTDSGYPRRVRRLQRGQELARAELLFEGEKKDVSARGYTVFRPEGSYSLITRALTFYESETYLLKPDGSRVRLQFPRDASFSGFFKGYALATLRSDWRRPDGTIKRGALVAVREADIMRKTPPAAAQIKVLFQPDARSSVSGVSDTRNNLVVDTLSNIRSRTLVLEESSGTWTTRYVDELSGGVSGVVSADTFGNIYTALYEDSITPERLFLADASSPIPPRVIKEMPARFDAEKFVLEQGSAVSKDGTLIPYFIVRQKDLKYDGSAPTLLYGYGGFEHSILPNYSASVGKLWLEQGGVYVLANIRGGGEFGPQWHSAALLKNRQKAFDDFLAVAKTLSDRKITSPARLGIMGGSNGGLLMGAAFTQKPELFGAVVCQVPLLDMMRYHKLLAGASWMGEYGDPDSKAMRGPIAAYSPYQNIKPGVKYPPVFFVTSSKDDRVHPGHARKSAAKLLEYGNDVFYFENIDGGHGAAANNNERARRMALEYSFLRMLLMPPAPI